MTSLDVVLRGGSLVAPDGDAQPADVGVAGGRVVQVGELPSTVETREEIDATGHYVVPGFIDAHVHADARLFDPQVQLALLSQGVTTVLLGQDGISFAPAPPGTLSYVEEYFGAVNGALPWRAPRGCNVADLLEAYDCATPVNVGYLAPHGTIRHAVLGLAGRRATDHELQGMVGLLEQALAEGALGMSTGLTYLPGCFGDTDELAALCTVLARTGGVHVSHMRGYDDQVAVGMAEVCGLAESTGCATHVSHYHGPGDVLLELLDDAVGRGVDVTVDSYPYLQGSSILAVAALPAELQADGPAATSARLAEPDVRQRLGAEWFPRIRSTVLEHVTLSHVGAAGLRWAEGMSLSAAAERAGSSMEEFVCELLGRSRMDVGCVLGQSGSSEEGVRSVLRHPAHMAGSDGIYVGSHPHPRGWGTFARLLGRHTRTLGDWHWGEAIRHLSTAACQRFGLTDRGAVRPGSVADLVVVDPERVADRSTYERPRTLAVGVHCVMVNGKTVFRAGALTGANPGRALLRRTHQGGSHG